MLCRIRLPLAASAALFVGSVMLIPAVHAATSGSDVPTIDVRPSCHAATVGPTAMRQDYQSCLDSEQHARDEIVQEWSQFTTADRRLCINAAGPTFEPTYTELASCLEMARDSRQLNKSSASDPLGLPPSVTR